MDDHTKKRLLMTFADGAAGTPTRAPFAAEPRFDAGRYWAYLDGIEATDAEKSALLGALWSLMRGFVELGFAVDAVQTLMPTLAAAALADEAGGDAFAAPMTGGFEQATQSAGEGP